MAGFSPIGDQYTTDAYGYTNNPQGMPNRYSFMQGNRPRPRYRLPGGNGPISSTYGGSSGTNGTNLSGLNSLFSSSSPSTFEGQSYDPMKDYNEIGNDYRSLIGKYSGGSGSPMSFDLTKYNPTDYNFNPTSDFTSAENQLKGITDTGGYSADDINDLRSRGISPIRSVYANAQQNIDRQKSLSGGFSPNYAATTAKMAREQAGQVSQATQNVNADIADKVNSNKINAIGQLAGLTKSESDLSNQFGRMNTDARNKAAEENANNQNDLNKFFAEFNKSAGDTKNENLFKSIQGLQSLYGTNPALSEMFGNQTLGRANLQNNINQSNRNRIMDLFKMFYGGGKG